MNASPKLLRNELKRKGMADIILIIRYGRKGWGYSHKVE